jgi:hypothetical protein
MVSAHYLLNMMPIACCCVVGYPVETPSSTAGSAAEVAETEPVTEAKRKMTLTPNWEVTASIARCPKLPPSPRRVAAGRRNRTRRGPITTAGRERLRQLALRNRPWTKATGPRAEEGKAIAARNGDKRRKGAKSVRQLRVELADVIGLVRMMAKSRKLLAEASSL